MTHFSGEYASVSVKTIFRLSMAVCLYNLGQSPYDQCGGINPPVDTINLYPDMTIMSDHFRYGLTAYGDVPIYIVELDATDRETVERWIEFTIDLRTNWPDTTKRLYTIMDLSKNDVSITNLATKRVQDLAKYNPSLMTHTGLVLRQTILGKIINTTTSILSRTMKAFDIQVFNDRESTYAWLVGLIEQVER